MKPVEILNYLVLQGTTIITTAVKSLKGHTFSSKIINFPKTQTIKGTVIVANQKNLEKEVKLIEKRLSKLLTDVNTSVAGIKIPNRVEVSNIDKTPLAEPVKIPPFPKEFTVKNPQKEVEITNFGELKKAITELKAEIKKIKLDPKIEVKAPIVDVKVPKPTIIEKMVSLFTDDPKKYVPVRLSDGKKFYEALQDIAIGAGRLMFSNNQGQKDQALIDTDRHLQTDVLSLPSEIMTKLTQIYEAVDELEVNIENINFDVTELRDNWAKRIKKNSEDTTIVYFGIAEPGTADSADGWRIWRITMPADGEMEMSWAGGNSDFDKCWDDREELIYS